MSKERPNTADQPTTGSALGGSSMSENNEASGALYPGGSNVIGSAGSSQSSAGGDRQNFDAIELAMVLSHYDLGVIEAIQPFPRGSRKAPKLIMRTEKGLYLLKRRAKGKDDPFKVAFAHELQLYLAERQFPLPHLIGTREKNNSMLRFRNAIYEIFEFIKGTGYDNSLVATHEAGKSLALFHKLLEEYQPEYEAPRGSYHASRQVHMAMNQAPKMLMQVNAHARKEQQHVEQLIQFLNDSYNDAAQKVNQIGLGDWPMQIIHSDWHPGNMLFRGTRVVAVIDYDAARVQQRIIDAANGALQFSIIGGGDDASQWPQYIDTSRYKRFLRAYDSVNVLSKAELQTIPWLMIEALIAESVIPIANTGSFANIDGLVFLDMVERKTRWLQDQAETLIELASE